MVMPLLLLLVLCLGCSAAQPLARPLVLLHGMLATNVSMAPIAQWALAQFPGSVVVNVYTGPKWTSIFGDLNEMTAQLATQLRDDERLRGGVFDAIGHSQGGLVLRAYHERYAHQPGYPRIANLISVRRRRRRYAPLINGATVHGCAERRVWRCSSFGSPAARA